MDLGGDDDNSFNLPWRNGGQTLAKEATMSAYTQIKADRETGRRNQAPDLDTDTGRVIGTR